MFQRQQNNRRTEGFSLIELMVSLSVFAIVMVVSTGTLIVLVDANAKAQALSSAMTNLSFALDSMTRELRMGYQYNCFSSSQPFPSSGTSHDCTGGSDAIAFTRTRDGVHMGYRLNGQVLEEKIASGNWVPLTANEVTIDTFELVVKNTDTYNATINTTGDANQPTIDLKIKGHVNNGAQANTDFNIQTFIVQRRLDIL